MKELFRKILFGDAAIREYATISVEGGIREKVYLRRGEGDPVDVSLIHWVLCLDPVVFGIWLNKGLEIFDEKVRCSMYFRDGTCREGEDPAKGALASLDLELVNKIEEQQGSLFLFRLSACRINHISWLRTHLIFSKYYRKPGLSFSKLKSFVSAYSYPRRVRIVSFRGEDYFNIFPMDLLGDIGQDGRWVFGLRHTNTALARIIEEKKIVVSEVPAAYKETIYRLGSHHSSSPPSIGELPFGVIESRLFKFWIPEWVESYKEIQILKTMNLGSHMLMWGQVLSESTIRPHTTHLYHIHYLLYLQQKAKKFSYTLL